MTGQRIKPIDRLDGSYGRIPPDMRPSFDEIMDPFLEAPDWQTRSLMLLQLAETDEPLVISHAVTSILEHLGEREITCTDAAAWYAISAHESWRKAAQNWAADPSAGYSAWCAVRPAYLACAFALFRGEMTG